MNSQISKAIIAKFNLIETETLTYDYNKWSDYCKLLFAAISDKFLEKDEIVSIATKLIEATVIVKRDVDNAKYQATLTTLSEIKDTLNKNTSR